MKAETDLTRHVLETAALSGVEIPAADLPAVVGVFTNLARVAAPLMAFQLPEELTGAPVYEAFESGTE
jgi:Protein of unknown function (DUF4089)